MIDKKLFLLFVGVLLIPSLASDVFAENTALQIELTYPNGDRVSLGNTNLVIESQDDSIHQELIGTSSEPYFTTELPVDSRYEILVYVNDMLAGTKYLSLDDKTEHLIKIPINPSVGMKFIAYYEDGKTPIEGALLELYSHNGNLIKSAKTDAEGKTLRFWVSSTIATGDHYRVKISISDDLVYESTEIRLGSGSSDFDIVTNWPAVVDFIKINSNLENYPNHSYEKNVVARVFNEQLEKSATFVRDSAHITELQVGKYQVWVFEKNNPSHLLANQTIIVDDNSGQYDVSVLNSLPESNVVSEPSLQVNSNPDKSEFLNDFSNLSWTKQSSSGQQTQNIDDNLLQLVTEGNNDAVFTRSSFDKMDLSDKKITISYSLDNISSLEQFWIYFSHDDFESWYTHKISVPKATDGKLLTYTFQISDSDITGEPDMSSLSQVQVRIKDNSVGPVTLNLYEFFIENTSSDQITNVGYSDLESCNCVAFRLDDIQDFFLADVQIELIKTFQRNNVDLTIGVIANQIGKDIDLTDFVSSVSDAPGIGFANHGWNHDDFAQFDTVGQEMLILRSNNKIVELFGVEPTVFIPPFNSYNDATVSALLSLEFTHFSSELDFATPPFPLSGQTLYHFPETAFTGELNDERTQFVGLSADTTFDQVTKSISEHGFAVVTLHPQEFSLFYHQNYQNDVNFAQIEQLEILFGKLNEHNIDTVLISEINTEPNQKLIVPQWIKNNAQWWVEDRVSTEEFVNSLEFLISEDVIHVSQTEQTGVSHEIPVWVKQNIEWWAHGFTSDLEFLNATEFLIQNGIIQI